MPLTLTVTQGVLPEGSEKLAFRRLGEAMLKWHGLTGNPVLTPNLVGSVIVLSPRETFAGLEESPVAFIEWRVPAFVFADREVQQGYIAEVTDIIHEMSGGKLPKDHVWVNVVHAVDGAWGIAGRAMTNTELLEAVKSA
jgi:hypothetical protein